MRLRSLTGCLILAAALAGSVVLGACGTDEDPGPPPLVEITLQPQPLATILPGCDNHELGEWLEVTGTLIYSFGDEALAGLERAPENVAPLVGRLTDLRDQIARQPVPTCADQIQREILHIVGGMLDAYQRFGNGEIDQAALREEVRFGRQQIDVEVAAMIDNTAQQLEAEFDDARAQGTPQP